MKHWHEEAERGTLGLRFDASAKPLVTVDVEKYQAYLDETDMTLAQKEAFLQDLWQIVVAFVELGFGVHPLLEVCGQNEESDGADENNDSDAVNYTEPKQEKGRKR